MKNEESTIDALIEKAQSEELKRKQEIKDLKAKKNEAELAKLVSKLTAVGFFAKSLGVLEKMSKIKKNIFCGFCINEKEVFVLYCDEICKYSKVRNKPFSKFSIDEQETILSNINYLLKNKNLFYEIADVKYLQNKKMDFSDVITYFLKNNRNNFESLDNSRTRICVLGQEDESDIFYDYDNVVFADEFCQGLRYYIYKSYKKKIFKMGGSFGIEEFLLVSPVYSKKQEKIPYYQEYFKDDILYFCIRTWQNDYNNDYSRDNTFVLSEQELRNSILEDKKTYVENKELKEIDGITYYRHKKGYKLFSTEKFDSALEILEKLASMMKLAVK